MLIFVLILVLFSNIAFSVILSKSFFLRCVRKEGMQSTQCSMLLSAAFGVSSSQMEADEIFVSSLSTTTGEYPLSRTIRLSMSKTESEMLYGLELLGVVNGKPREVARYMPRLSCRNYSPQSSTDPSVAARCFCCPCIEQRKILSGSRRGRKRVCPKQLLDFPGNPVSAIFNAFKRRGCSLHCMELSRSWFAVFRVKPPAISYTITLAIDQHPDIFLTPSYTSASFDFGQAFLIGDYAVPVDKTLHISGYKFFVKIKNSQIMNMSDLTTTDLDFGQGGFFIADYNADLSGHSCNKIGVHPHTFKTHSQMCGGFVDECLDNQIEDLIKNGLAQSAGDFLCKNAHFKNLTISCPVNFRQTSRVVLQLNATDLVVLTGDPEIEVVSVETRPILGERRRAEIGVTVTNKDDQLPGNYGISFIDCSGELTVEMTKNFHLMGDQTKRISVILEARTNLHLNSFNCTMEIFSESEGRVFFSDVINIRLAEEDEDERFKGRDDNIAHVMTHEPQEFPVSKNSTNSCADCETVDVFCLIRHNCISEMMSEFVATLTSIIFVTILLCWGKPIIRLVTTGIRNIAGLFKLSWSEDEKQ